MGALLFYPNVIYLPFAVFFLEKQGVGGFFLKVGAGTDRIQDEDVLELEFDGCLIIGNADVVDGYLWCLGT